MRHSLALPLVLLLAAAAAVQGEDDLVQATGRVGAATQGGNSAAGWQAAAAASTAADESAALIGDATAVQDGIGTAASKAGITAAAAELGDLAGASSGVAEVDAIQPQLAIDTAEMVVRTEVEADAAVEAGLAAQVNRKRKKVVSHLVMQAKPAELPFGYDDVPIDGACRADARRFCPKVKPGEGALAGCLLAQLQDAELEGSRPGAALGRACQKQLEEFLGAFTSNVNANLPIAKKCKKDIEEHCAHVAPEDEGGVLDCLRRRRRTLRKKCQKLVFELEQTISDDYRLDKALLGACSPDISRLCAEGIEDPHGGAVQACLLQQFGALDMKCQRELFRLEMEESDDIRLSVGLMHACYDSKEEFCEGVAPGESNVKDCLEAHMYEDGFDDGCRAFLEAMINTRSQYFRLDSIIRQHCGPDISFLCGIPDAALLESVDFLGNRLPIDEAGISNCLQDHRDELQDPVCKRRVTRVIAATFRDVRYNFPLAEACAADRQKLCAAEPLGSASVLRCLGRQRQRLDPACAARLFDTEVSMAENIDFNWPLKEACTAEISQYCGGVEHGRGRVIRCLEHAAERHKHDFSERCQEAVEAFEERAGSDYRLNARLADECKHDVEALCPDACGALQRKTGCGGSVLHCLASSLEFIRSDDCRSEVEYYQRMRVRHFKNDVALAEACREDVKDHCEDAEDEDILPCLHRNRGRLSGPCRAIETQLAIEQGRSVDLWPAVFKACAEERKSHCGGVRPGDGAVLNCLLTGATIDLSFSGGCIEALDALQERHLLDWRTDWNMHKACGRDVDKHCAEANMTAGPSSTTGGLDGGVFTCLVEAHHLLESGCAAEVTRAAATALDFYKPVRPALSACDDDVAALCPPHTHAERPSLGITRDCLAAHLEASRAAELPASAFTEPFDGTGAVVLDMGSSERRRRRRLTSLGAGAGEAAWRRRQQEQVGEEESGWEEDVASSDADGLDWVGRHGKRGEPGSEAVAGAALSNSCRAFLEVALPQDAYARFQDSMTATGVLTQLASVESALGLPHGSLHNPAATSGTDVLTLTGWVALAGMFALATVVLSLVVYALRRYTGLGAPNAAARGYTMVVKHETELAAAPEASPARGLPRRYG